MPAIDIVTLGRFLDSIQVPYRCLGSPETGRVLVIEEGARILAMTPPGSDTNVLWTHPSLSQCTSRKELSSIGAGGMGGLRLWQAPEAAYHWKGIAEPKTFSNYKLQQAMDPGAYLLRESSKSRCTIEGSVTLIDYRTETQITCDIRRIIELAALPNRYAACGGAGFRLRMENHLSLRTGNETSRVDLWHLMQLPVPCSIGAPVRPDMRPEVYFNPESCDGWEARNGCFIWQTNGKRMAKVGLGTDQVTGGPFAVRKNGTTLEIYLWEVPIRPDQEYVDAAPGRSDRNQVIQFWDGFDFCEVEYHSPGASLQQPKITDISEMTYLEIPVEKLEVLRTIVNLPPI